MRFSFSLKILEIFFRFTQTFRLHAIISTLPREGRGGGGSSAPKHDGISTWKHDKRFRIQTFEIRKSRQEFTNSTSFHPSLFVFVCWLSLIFCLLVCRFFFDFYFILPFFASRSFIHFFFSIFDSQTFSRFRSFFPFFSFIISFFAHFFLTWNHCCLILSWK